MDRKQAGLQEVNHSASVVAALPGARMAAASHSRNRAVRKLGFGPELKAPQFLRPALNFYIMFG